MAFEARRGPAQASVLSDAEREALAGIVDELSRVDYDTINDQQYLDQLRPRARAILDRLGWRGAIDPRILPGRVVE